MRKFYVCLAALAGWMAAASAQAAVINLANAGWTVEWSDALSPVVSVQDLGTSSGISHIGLTLIFNDQSLQMPDFFAPLPITFVQSAATVSPEVVVRTTVVNESSTALGGLTFKLLGGLDTHFDVSAMNIGAVGGLSVAPFTASFTPDQKQMNLAGGNVPSGKTYVLSHDAGVVVGSSPGAQDNPNAFSFKVQPSPAVPEPATLGLMVLGSLSLLAGNRGKK